MKKRPRVRLKFSRHFGGLVEFNVYLRGWCNDYSAVVAVAGDKVVGCFSAYLQRGGKMKANGTWVRRDYRKAGLARRMWKLMLKRLKPTGVSVYTVSEGGAALVGSLRKEYPELRWRHDT